MMREMKRYEALREIVAIIGDVPGLHKLTKAEAHAMLEALVRLMKDRE